MELRRATQNDAAALLGLINQAFTVERFFIDADRLDLAGVCERFVTGEYLVLEEKGALAACVYLERRGERCYLGLLSVAPERQGQGIGSRLMAEAEAHCRRAGCRYIDLRLVNLREELPAFYRKHGYREIGTSAFPADQPVKMACHFVEMSKEI